MGNEALRFLRIEQANLCSIFRCRCPILFVSYATPFPGLCLKILIRGKFLIHGSTLKIKPAISLFLLFRNMLASVQKLKQDILVFLNTRWPNLKVTEHSGGDRFHFGCYVYCTANSVPTLNHSCTNYNYTQGCYVHISMLDIILFISDAKEDCQIESLYVAIY